MEVFRAPRVTLIARPEFLEPEHLPVQWQGTASAGERLAEFAGRLCYMSQHNPAHRSTAEYLENIKKQGHGSVLDHARAAHQRGRGARDPADGDRVPSRPRARGAGVVLRFRDLSRRRQTRRRARRVSQSLTRVDDEKISELPIAHRSGVPYCLLDNAFRSTDRTSGLFCGRSPETKCASVSHTTKNPIPRPTLNPTVPATRSQSGTTHPPSLRWRRLSVSSAM